MDSTDVHRWFDEYLEVFAACGRGERDTESLLAYYGVPLLLTTDERFLALADGDAIVAAVRPQIEGGCAPPAMPAPRSSPPTSPS